MEKACGRIMRKGQILPVPSYGLREAPSTHFVIVLSRPSLDSRRSPASGFSRLSAAITNIEKAKKTRATSPHPRALASVAA